MAAPLRVSQQDLVDLAKIMYLEARGNPQPTDLAHVAETIANRAADVNGYFPESISGVIREPGQFEPVTVGRFDAAAPPTDEQLAQALAILDTYGANPQLRTNAAFFENPEITRDRGTGLTANLDAAERQRVTVFEEEHRHSGDSRHVFYSVELNDKQFDRQSQPIPNWQPEYSPELQARIAQLRQNPAYAEMVNAITKGQGNVPQATPEVAAASAASGLTLPPELAVIAADFKAVNDPLGAQLEQIVTQYNNRQIDNPEQVQQAIQALQTRTQEVFAANNVPVNSRTWMLSTHMGAYSAAALFNAPDTIPASQVQGLQPASLAALRERMVAAGMQVPDDFSALTAGQVKAYADQLFEIQTRQAANLAQNGAQTQQQQTDMDFFGMLTGMLGPEIGGFLGFIMTIVTMFNSGNRGTAEAALDSPREQVAPTQQPSPEQQSNPLSWMSNTIGTLISNFKGENQPPQLPESQQRRELELGVRQQSEVDTVASALRQNNVTETPYEGSNAALPHNTRSSSALTPTG